MKIEGVCLEQADSPTNFRSYRFRILSKWIVTRVIIPISGL